jgi:hypothetical protein
MVADMNQAIAEAFAAQWADAWNRRDIESVLAHFHENVVFVSPTALAVTGSSTVRGKAALRAYWTKAMAGISALHFTVDRILWANDRRELAIVYQAAINGQIRRVSENLTLDSAALVVAAEVFHGALRES